MVWSGDFKKILPIIPKGSRQDIVHATINASYLWQFCQVLTLTKNMRLLFGSTKPNIEDSCEDTTIEIPNYVLIPNSGDPMTSIVQSTYPSLLDDISEPTPF